MLAQKSIQTLLIRVEVSQELYYGSCFLPPPKRNINLTRKQPALNPSPCSTLTFLLISKNAKASRILRARIYRSSRSPDAYLFDFSACKQHYTDQQCMMELKNRHPNVHACLILNEGPTRYLEVYVQKSKDVNDILKNGTVFADADIIVLPCHAISDQSQIIF